MVTYYALALSNILNVTRVELVTLQRSSQEKSILKEQNLKGKEAEKQVRQKTSVVSKKPFSTILK